MTAPAFNQNAFLAGLAKLPKLAGALAKVQGKLPKLERDRTVTVEQKNGETYSYSYSTLANLSDAVLPLLSEHGLAFAALPGTGSDGKMCLRYLLLHESGECLPGEFPISGEGGIQMIGGRITYARRYCLGAITGVAAEEDDETRLADEGAPRTAQRAAPRGRQSARPAPEAQGDRPTAQRAQRRSGGPPLPGEDESGEAPRDAITEKQLKHLHTLFTKVDMPDRAARLQHVNEILAETDPGRQVDTSTMLTKDEATLIIDRLKAWADQLEPGGES